MTFNLDFGKQVDDWVKETEQRMTAVFRASAQALAREVTTSVHSGGRLPFQTGNLQRSFLASTTAMPRTAGGGVEFSSAADFGPVIASVPLGGKVYMGFQAAYARRLEYGFVGVDSLGRDYNQSGRMFVLSAAVRWPAIVAEQTEKIRGRVAARTGA